MKKSPFFVKKLNPNAFVPKKGSEKAAGYDICSLEECLVPAQGKYLVKTGLSFAVPSGNYARIAPRSGLALKNFIDVGAGVVDEDYRGEVGVLLFNHSTTDFKVNRGDRIAQVIIEKITDTEIIEVEDLNDTERGQGGFGSTGISHENIIDDSINIKKRKIDFKDFNLMDKENFNCLDKNNENVWKGVLLYKLKQITENKLITQEEEQKYAKLIFSGDEKIKNNFIDVLEKGCDSMEFLEKFKQFLN